MKKIDGAKEILKLENKKKRLIGNASLSCAFVSYCGPFNAEYRKLLVNDYY